MIDRVATIRRRLEEALAPSHLELWDDSESHAGHPGAAQSGGGHFYATIVSSAFEGRSLVARHKLVYQALGDLMKTEIHAFSMKVLSPSEYQNKGNP
jgi:BolA protein